MYPMKRIEYAIEYVKDKLIDQNGVIKIVNEENYKPLLKEGAAFLSGMIQRQLKKVLIENNLLYWAAENSNAKKLDEECDPFSFLTLDILVVYIKAIILKDSGSHKNMKYLYCSSNNSPVKGMYYQL
ncbi:hypothetical protein RFI_34464 [Reticulomyxa filosa]|uniref:Uncharacterized protein n=1 Tax=Reticulomyxa filosa TaxID=46433 RepID=X6LNL2_RETFI|nr:hypothetical protein RFI_34464 [Reticulomyxa filosa]|eukprot:ETO02946.1 hypothetical protein RFI_34464 [Reticulomyxa filosa]